MEPIERVSKPVRVMIGVGITVLMLQVVAGLIQHAF